MLGIREAIGLAREQAHRVVATAGGVVAAAIAGAVGAPERVADAIAVERAATLRFPMLPLLDLYQRHEEAWARAKNTSAVLDEALASSQGGGTILLRRDDHGRVVAALLGGKNGRVQAMGSDVQDAVARLCLAVERRETA